VRGDRRRISYDVELCVDARRSSHQYAGGRLGRPPTHDRAPAARLYHAENFLVVDAVVAAPAPAADVAKSQLVVEEVVVKQSGHQDDVIHERSSR